MEKEQFINLEDLIRSKNPRLLKILPGFLLNYIKRVIHQDGVNEIIYKYGDKYGIDFVNAVLAHFGVIIKEERVFDIPATGRYIVAANHPLGGLDGLALMSVVSKRRTDIKFIVNDLLLNLENLKPLFIPVNKFKKNTIDVSKLIDETYKSDQIVLTFPAGLCSRKQSGKITDLEWKKSFITQAKKYKRDIILANINGRNSNFFYNLANVRKLLGVKQNIEMFYLVDEMFKQKDKIINIKFSKPISYESLSEEFKDIEWAEKLKQKTYLL